jgi:hypothetical protein
MISRSWVFALLLVLASPLPIAGQTASPAQLLSCSRLNTDVYGNDGRGGLAQTYRVLKNEIGYVDQLILHSQTKETADLRAMEQAQRTNPGARIVSVDLQTDRHLAATFGTLRRQLEAELENVSRAIRYRRGELQRRGCQERIDPKTGQSHIEETTPYTLPGEAPMCALFRRSLQDAQGLAAARKRAEDLFTTVHNILLETQQHVAFSTGREDKDIADELRANDAGLEQMRSRASGASGTSGASGDDRMVSAESLVTIARECPDLQALLPSGVPRTTPTPFIPNALEVTIWDGTYTNGEETDTLSASGNSLTGKAHWERPGGLRSDETLSPCAVNRNTAVCASKGTYEDGDKTVTLTSKWELTVIGKTLWKKETITGATWAWKNGDKHYTPAVHKDAVFTGTYTRQ